jgi:periplasmic divalent cation tolerance protein
MNESPEIIVIFSTAPADKSEVLARMLIDKRIVACVNVVPVHSYYRWNDQFCSEPEHLLIAKTTQEKADEVIAAIKAHHPYAVPEIIALPVSGGHLPYLEWVFQEVSK